MTPSFFGPEAWAPLGRALVAFFQGAEDGVLTVLADEGDPEPMPVSLFFRSRDELREADREALVRVRGRVLDGGAGVGALSLLLQEDGVEVTSVEVVPEAVEIMRARGVLDVREGRLEDLSERSVYDTILLMMNGTALAGSLDGLPALLGTLGGLLAPGGQVLLDSTDLLGPEPGEGGGGPERQAGWENGLYPGELQYQMEFEGERGAPFPQLFVDPQTLGSVVVGEGWLMEVVWRGPEGEYLARLTRAGKRDSG